MTWLWKIDMPDQRTYSCFVQLSKIIDCNCNFCITQIGFNKRLYFIPCLAGKTTSDSWHMNRCVYFLGKCCDLFKSGWYCIIPDRGITIAVCFDLPLPNDISYPDIITNLYKLNFTQWKTILWCISLPVLPFRLIPFLWNSQYKAFAPSAYIITDMSNDFVSHTLWTCGITFFVLNINCHITGLLSSNITSIPR